MRKSTTFFFLLLAALLCCASCAARKMSLVMTEDERHEAYIRLDKGDKFISYTSVQGSNTKHGKIVAVVDAPLEKVWRVITDYDRMHEYMPLLMDSRLLTSKGNTAVARYKFGITGLPLTYEVRIFVLHDALRHEIRWYYAGGDINDTYGSCTLRPFLGEERTLLTYTVFMDIANTLVGPFAKFGTGVALPQMIEAVRGRMKTVTYRDWSPPPYASPIAPDPDDPFEIEFGEYE